jgi:hypothetical protein
MRISTSKIAAFARHSLMTLLLFTASQSFATLSGTYTIDSSAAASSTNYKDFLSAVNDMKSGTRSDGGTPNGAGLSGAVVFNVAAGTYPGQFDLASISGISSTNTLTFDGGAGNAASVIVTHAGTSTALAYTIRISNLQYVTLQNLTIRGTGNYAWPVHLMGTTSNVKVKNCLIQVASSYNNHTSTNYCGFVMNNNTTSPTSGTSAAVNVEIDSNRISGGYGNYFVGNGSNTGIKFRGNHNDSTYYYGLYITSMGELTISNNEITMNPSGNVNSMGLYMSGSNATSGNQHVISGNKVINAGTYGFYINSSNGQSATRALMANNAIGGGFRNSSAYGIYLSSYMWDIYFNSVNIDHVTTGTSAAFYFGTCCTSGANANDIRNNIFAVTAAGSSAYPFYYSSTSSLQYVVINNSSLNNNIYWKAGITTSDPIIYYGGLTQTPANFINNGGYNTNSYFRNPGFTSATQLVPMSACNNGAAITGITTDIAGTTRSNPPDIGAYEVSSVSDDIGIESFAAPTTPFNPGAQNISVVLRNYGSNTITSAQVTYAVNGGSPVTVSYSGSLAPCASTTITFSGANQFTFQVGVPYTIQAYASYPNGTTDANNLNDSTTQTMFSALSGNYTIDQGSAASSTNFPSFTDAANALNSGGVNGPVTLTVMGTSPYNEQVRLMNVPGISSTNTITFDGGAGNAANRLLTYAATSQTSSYTFRIENTPYITVRNLTIRATGNSYGWPVHILGNNSSNIDINNCIINFVGGNGTNATNDYFSAVVINNSPTNTSGGTSTATNINIDSNTISGGYYGVIGYFGGSAGHNIRYNNISNVYYTGVYLFLSYASRINNNVIAMRTSGPTNSMGVSSNNCYSSGPFQHEIMNNIITDAGGYGLYLYYFNYNTGGTNRAKVVNNMIGGNFRSSDASGIYLTQNVSNVDVWFNSVNLDNVASGAQAAAFRMMNNVSGIDVKNNVFAVTNSGSSAYALYCDATSGFATLNYNNYYRAGNPLKLMNLFGTDYSISSFQNALGYNANSMNIDPAYAGAKDLHTSNSCANGTAISGYTTDIDGDTRSTPPDMGVDENMSTLSLDMAVQGLSAPELPASLGTQDVRVIVRNNGSTTITSAEVNYSVNGGTLNTINWSGSLAPCDSQTVVFNATSGPGGTDQRVTFLPGTAYSIKAYTSNPNGSTDLNGANDTLNFGPVCGALDGTYTVDSATAPSLTNFQTFTSAVMALTCGGVRGPVVLNVLQGTYTGQVDISTIPGSSAVNTVLIDGGAGNAATRIITYAGSTSNSLHTLRINNASNITLRNLTIRNTSTSYGWPLHILGNSSNIEVKNCIVDFQGGNGFASTSTNFIALVLNNYSASASPTSGLWTGTNVQIDSNWLTGSSASAYLVGNGTNTGLTFRNNTCDSAYGYGVYATNLVGTILNYNTINMRTTGSTSGYGMFLSSVSANTTMAPDVSWNRVYNAGQTSFYLSSSSGTSAMRARMINNIAGGGFRSSTPSGLYFTSSNYWNVWHNSVNIDNAASGTSGAAYFVNATYNDCRNNVFAVTNGSSGTQMFPFRSSSTSFTALNYNNYYKALLASQHIQVNGITYDTSNYNTASSGGVNSIMLDPVFAGIRDLTPGTPSMNGQLMAAVPRDINDSVRNNPPDMGAIEIGSGLSNDLGIVSVYSPDTFLSSGLRDVIVTVRNFGSTAITQFNLRHTVNGSAMQDSAFSGFSLAANDTLRVSMTGAKRVSLTAGVSTLFKVYLHLPNGSTDDNLVNDTVSIGPKIPALNGNYTINPSGSGNTNFTSFRNAVGALMLAGVSGPVTFNVATGSYNEQVTIPAISGASASNPIVFDGGAGNAATRVLDTAANSTSNYWTVRLNGAQYVTLRNLTIRASGTNYGVGVQISGNSHYSGIKHCVVEIGSAGASSTSSSFIPVLITSTTSITSPTSGTSQVNYLEIDSNTINNGYYGIYGYSYTGTPYCTANKFRGNTINNAFYYGIYLYYYDGYTFSNNTINMRNVSVSSYGAYFYFCYTTGTNSNTVNGNKVINAGSIGMYLYYGGGATRSTVSNNMIGGGFRNNGGYGLSMQYLTNYNVWHNTVNMDYPQSNDQYSALYLNNGSGMDVRNNIFAYTASNASSGMPVYIGSLPTGLFRLDNNNYFRTSNPNSNLLYLAGSSFNSTNLVNGGGYNSASLSKPVTFASATDLHIEDGCNNGVQLAVADDFDGNVRNNPPDIGADEISGINDDIGILSIAPFSAGLQDVRVVIRNNGTNTISSSTVSYSVNGGTARIISWSGTLAPCDTTTVSFTGSNQYNFALGTAYTVVAWTSNPNATADPRTSNDTVTLGPTCIFISGNYTINPSGSGASNFTSFSAAAAALTCGGVSGPVRFAVAPGTYNEQVLIGNIAGASATNTVSFIGDTSSMPVITYAPTSSSTGYTLRLNGSQYVRLRNLSIQSSGTSYGNPLHLMGSCNYTQVKNCRIGFTGTALTSGNSGYSGIIINNYADVYSPTSTGSQVTGLEIDSNVVSYGYYGIVFSGYSSTPYSSNNYFRNNRIDSSYYYGFYVYYNEALHVKDNSISMRVNGSTTSLGLYMAQCYNNGTSAHEVTGNTIINAGGYGIYMYFSSGISSNRSKFYNNMVGGGFRTANAYGIYWQYTDYWDIWHNSVNMDIPTSSAQYSAMNIYYYANLDIRNNQFAYTATSGAGLPFYFSGSSNPLTTLNFNNYYNAGGTGLVYLNGPTLTAATYNAGGAGVNSRNTHPSYLSATDLHLGTGCIRGQAISGVTTDIDGNTRSSTPNIGADEFIGSVNNDIGVSFIVSPNAPFTGGTQDVLIRISNYGANTVSSATVKYSINGGTPKSYSWTGTLGSCDTTTIAFTGSNQFNFAPGGSYTIRAYTESPNSTSDANMSNDTIISTVCPALNGNYTINPSGSGSNNFTSFTAAANVLNCGGITGPVTFTVSPGTYNEQVTLNTISGASATNTIIFDGQSAASTTVTYTPSTSLTAYTVRLNASPYVTFQNMTIVSAGGNWGTPFHIMGASNYVKVKNCVLTFSGTGQASTSSAYAGLVINNYADLNSPTGSGSLVTGLEIDSNVIRYGYFGICMTSVTSNPYSSNNSFRYNRIDSAYYYGIYTYYNEAAKIKGNRVSMRVLGTTSSIGIYFYVCLNGSGSGYHEISGNRVINAGQYGIYVYNSYSSSTNRSRLMNNMVGGGFRSTSSIGIYMQYSDYWDVWHNSVNLDFATNSTTYSAFNTNYTTADIRNNHFAYTAASGSGLAYYGGSTVSSLNYNNYYNASGTNLMYSAGSTYTSSNFTSGGGANSKNVNPNYASNTDLRTGGCLKGVSISAVTVDIDGDARNNPPDIGADESLSNDAGVVDVTAPTPPISPGAQNVALLIKNFGNNVINTLTVTYNINGTGAVSQSLSGMNLQPCSTQTVTFTGAQQFTFGTGGANVVAYTSAPNGGTDNFRTNDTLKTSLCGPLSGTFTIDPTGAGHFMSINAAINAMSCAGITGPVVFNVAAGTYAEQVTIPAISGASATNTVTFDGGAGNAATRILTYGASQNNARHTLRFNGCQYVTVKNLTIQATGANYEWGVHFTGTAHNNALKHCIVDLAGSNATTTTSSQYAGIVASASTTSESSPITLHNLQIDSNTVNNGYYGIMLYGNTGSQDTSLMVRGNVLNSQYYYGAYIYGHNGLTFNNNRVSMRTGIYGSQNNMGVYMTNNTATGTRHHEVIGNIVTDAAQYGMYMSNNTSASSVMRSRFWNNMVGGGFQSSSSYGVYFQSNSYWDVFQNTINLDAPTSNTQYAAFYISSGSGNSVKNNIFSYTAQGTGLPYYANSTAVYTNAAAFNYNMFYKAGNTATSQLIYSAGNYTNTTVIGGGGSNANSLVRQPVFVGTRNLHVYDGCYNGDSLGVTMDVDGDARASYPDMGADEVPSGADDIGVMTMLEPTIPISPGTQDIRVIIKNYGSNTVYGGTVRYSVNGGSAISTTFTDTIDPCDTAIVVFTGAQQYTFASGTSYDIKVYTEAPNATTDTYHGNDTLSSGTLCVGMAGTYTINPSGSGSSNFPTFSDAINALLCGGVSGQTVFNVSAGTYNEQVHIPAILGASATNRIVFNGAGAATTLITYGSTSSTAPHTVRMYNASFITLQNLTIRSTSTSIAWPVHIVGNSNNIRVRNNVIEITGSGAVGTSTNFIPVVLSGSLTSIYTNGLQDSIEVDSNVINGGYASVWDYNNNGTANRFRGNTLNDPYYYGLYIYYTSEVKVMDNTINMQVAGSNTSVGVYLYNCNNQSSMMHEISGNRIYDMGQYGVYNYFTAGNNSNPARMYNNIITGFRNTGSHSGIFQEYSAYWKIYFNTINSDTATSGVAGAVQIQNTSNNDVRNNIMAVTAAGSQMLPFYTPTSSNVTVLDYNNYYKTGSVSTLIYLGAGYSPSTYIGALGLNNNSFSRDPLFDNRRNLHVGNGCNNGIAVTGFTTDIDGQTRNNPPDVGADEMTGGVSDNLGVTAIVSPTLPLATGFQDVSVIVTNMGTNMVTTGDVSYSVNGGSPVTISITDTIQPCDTMLVVFTGSGQYDFALGGSYTIKAYTSNPNGTADGNAADDTTTLGPICPAMSGSYTIDPAGSGVTNFTTFNEAVSALNCGGISDDVTFMVSNGTYSEQVNINTIAGANDTTRVSFIGTSQSGTVLTFSALSPTSSHTLRLNNSPYVTFDNMTIQANGASYGTAVHIMGSSNFVKIKRCLIRISGTAANSTSSAYIPLLINASTDVTNPGNGSFVTNLEIDSNRIVAGYYSVYMTGRTSTPYSNTNYFRRNAIDSGYQYGVYFNYLEAIKFQNNAISIRVNGTTGSYGMYMNQCNNSGSAFHDISSNKIITAGQIGFYTYFSAGTSTTRSKFVNNMIGGGFRSSASTGLQWQYSDYWDIYHNTVVLDYVTNSTNYSAAYFYHYTNYTLDIRNNIFNYTPSTGTGLPFSLGGTSTISTFNYNNLYNAASTSLEYINGTTYTSSTFAGGGGFNANSVSNAPSFVSTSNNLHLSASGSKGTNITSVPADIDGETRASAPDLGADEYYSSMDIGVLAIDSPSTTSFCGTDKNIVVRIKNYGNQNVLSASLYLTVNGNTVNVVSWSGTLGLGGVSSPINLGTFSFASGSYTVEVSTTAPNGGTDVNGANDTARTVYNITQSVTPTITMNASATSICSGMPVTFTATGTNGGPTPSYQWRKNGITVGTNDTFYSSTTLAHNDSIIVILTSTATCATPSNVVSNYAKMNVGTSLAPDVSILANTTSICPGGSVRFTATPVNGGSAPSYQWKQNGVDVGTDSNIFVASSVTDQDSFTVVLTSSLGCAIPPKDTSNFIKITVNQFVAPSVAISAGATTICAGTVDTFYATPTYGGTSPVYQWKKNGVNVGTNNLRYITTTLADNDTVEVVMTSNGTCANPATVTSPKIGMTVIPTVTPSVTVSASATTVCTGTAVTFSASVTNGGSTPVLQWKKNGVNVGIDSVGYELGAPVNNDTVYAVLTSNATCATPAVVTSNRPLIKVNPMVTPVVTIAAQNSTICSGSVAQLTATPSNGGTSPSYQWSINGVNTGTDTSVLITSSVNNNDTVRVVMTSNASCLTRTDDSSNAVVFTVTPNVTPTVSVTANNSVICAGTPVTFSASITNGGTTPHFQWKRNGANVGKDSIGYIVSNLANNDSVWVVFTSGESCVTTNNVASNKTTITVNPVLVPTVSIAASATTACSGTPVTFTATTTNGGTTPAYQWKINGVDAGPNNDTFSVSTLSNNDTVQLVMTSSATCASPVNASSSKVKMTINPSLTPDVTVLADAAAICAGSNITFRARPVNGGTAPVYQWQKNGTNAGTNDTVFTTSINGSDVIRVIMTTSLGGCLTTTKDTTDAPAVTVKAIPQQPVITRTADTLVSTLADSYQWIYNNNPVSGATNQKYKAGSNFGYYKVAIDSNGCNNISDSFNYQFIGLDEKQSLSLLNVYPNPATSHITIAASFTHEDEVTLTLYDLAGKQISVIHAGRTAKIDKMDMDLNGIAAGAYILQITHGSNNTVHKLMKAD